MCKTADTLVFETNSIDRIVQHAYIIYINIGYIGNLLHEQLGRGLW